MRIIYTTPKPIPKIFHVIPFALLFFFSQLDTKDQAEDSGIPEDKKHLHC